MFYFLNQCTVLQHLAGNIELQVGGIDNPFHKTQIIGYQRLDLIGDKYLVYIQLQPVLFVRLKQIIRRF